MILTMVLLNVGKVKSHMKDAACRNIVSISVKYFPL